MEGRTEINCRVEWGNLGNIWEKKEEQGDVSR